MDVLDPMFIRQLLDMPHQEALAFYTGPVYTSLSPEDREKLSQAVFHEQCNLVVAEMLHNLNSLPRPPEHS